MYKRRAIAGLIAGLLLGATPAFAFEETPAPDGNRAPPPITTPAMKLAPANAPIDPQDERKGGVKVFGYNVLPKLNFGLDVLYGEKRPQPDPQQDASTDEDNGDVSVLAKFKRLF